MSHEFKCLDWENKKQVVLEGSASATGTSGNGTPGVFMRLPKGSSFISADEFCEIVRYFFENYDLTPDDPRLALLLDLKKARRVKGYNGPKSRRLTLERKA